MVCILVVTNIPLKGSQTLTTLLALPPYTPSPTPAADNTALSQLFYYEMNSKGITPY